MAATEIIPFNRESPSPEVIDRLAEHILIGGVAIVPTDTVYGLVGDATADIAAEAIFKLKNRPSSQALPVFVDRPGSLYRWNIRLQPKYMCLTEKFWPGPLTLVVPVWPGFSLHVGGNGRSVGVRKTGEPIVQALMSKARRYLLATSANPSGTEPQDFDIARWLEESPDGRILWCKPENYTPGVVSSVIDLTGKAPVLVRAGAIPVETCKNILPDLQLQR